MNLMTKKDARWLGATLRAIRVSKEMTQVEFAQAVGVAQNNISRYECGERQPRYATLLRLVRDFNVSPLVLFPSNKGRPRKGRTHG